MYAPYFRNLRATAQISVDKGGGFCSSISGLERQITHSHKAPLFALEETFWNGREQLRMNQSAPASITVENYQSEEDCPLPYSVIRFTRACAFSRFERSGTLVGNEIESDAGMIPPYARRLIGWENETLAEVEGERRRF